MASEGTITVPRMGSFRRVLFGYKPSDVDTALASRDARAWALRRDAEDAAERSRAVGEAAARAEDELASLSAMVIEREREIRGLREQMAEANARHDRGIASLEAVSVRLEEIHSQARGQATRIRMKALREAVEVARRARELTEAQGAVDDSDVERAANGLYEGVVKVEVGPFDDFSQLVGFEDAAGQIGATSEISVERFSEGRATISMRLDEPVELLRELEERSPFEFQVRRTADDNLVLDVDDEPGPEQQAA
jgi:hypothetical protein